VAAQAGVSQGTIYWYFDSKEELLSAALLSYVEGLASEVMDLTLMGESAADKLRALAAGMDQFADSGARLFTMILEFWASSSRREEAAALWIDLLAEFKDAFVSILEEGIQSGEFRAVYAEDVVWAVMATYDGLAAYMLLKPDLDLARVSRAFTDALLYGLLTNPEAGDEA
jgi:AcrR family transcriptional regulator